MLESVPPWMHAGLSALMDWPMALGLALFGVFLLIYFSREAARPRPAQQEFSPLDAETLKLLKDLEGKAREFDAFVADKIFEDVTEGKVASDENWATEARSRKHLRLIKSE